MLVDIKHMKYTVAQLAKISGVSVRTLHYYDEVNLLNPKRNSTNDYRYYENEELLRLQQILFFKELDFPLNKIKKILLSSTFDMKAVLRDQKKLIEIKKNRLNKLIKTIDKTINSINKKTNMNDNEIYDGFSKEELEAWNKEAKERWGNTPQYKQSVGKYESLTREQKLEMKKAGEDLMREFVRNMPKGPKSPEVQALVQKHYDALKFFYEPNLEMYRGLADMYVGYQGDTRFRAYFEKHDPKLPEFMRDAIYEFCESNK
jgi:DNA-binding transcriptional MerR regulator